MGRIESARASRHSPTSSAYPARGGACECGGRGEEWEHSRGLGTRAPPPSPRTAHMVLMSAAGTLAPLLEPCCVLFIFPSITADTSPAGAEPRYCPSRFSPHKRNNQTREKLKCYSRRGCGGEGGTLRHQQGRSSPSRLVMHHITERACAMAPWDTLLLLLSLAA